ncbi:MAG: hypothetical protein PHZ13_12300, partial [bacterium]|nr:hypothetical protein [bacterium]
GTLSVQRLVFTGSEDSIIYQLNNIGDLVSTNVSKLDGYVLEDNTVHADKIIAESISARHIGADEITANHILSGSITVDKIATGAIQTRHIDAGQITVNHLASGFEQSLNLESNQSIQSKVETMISGKADITDLDGFVTQEDINTTYGTYFDQTEQAFSGQVREVREYAEGVSGNLNAYKEELSAWWRFDLNGLHIGELDSPFEVNLRGDAMEFKQDGIPIASVTNHMLKIDSSQLTNQLIIGNDDDGYMTLDAVEGALICTWEAQRS